MPNIQLAANLCFLREQRGLTQKELSNMLNISRQAYSNYERCERTPDLDTLLRLSQFYRISLDDLVLANLRHPENFSTSHGIAETSVPYTLSRETDSGNTVYLSRTELQIIADFRAASEDTRQIIAGFLKNNIR